MMEEIAKNPKQMQERRENYDSIHRDLAGDHGAHQRDKQWGFVGEEENVGEKKEE